MTYQEFKATHCKTCIRKRINHNPDCGSCDTIVPYLYFKNRHPQHPVSNPILDALLGHLQHWADRRGWYGLGHWVYNRRLDLRGAKTYNQMNRRTI